MITEWYNDREYLLPYLDEMLEQSGSNEDWKREFTALIPEDMFEVYNTAAIFFTGAPLEVSRVEVFQTTPCVGARRPPGRLYIRQLQRILRSSRWE